MADPISVKPFLFVEIRTGRTNSGFPKTVLGKYLFACVEYLRNRNPKMRTKNFKNYSSIFYYCKLRELAGCFTPFKVAEILNKKFLA